MMASSPRGPSSSEKINDDDDDDDDDEPNNTNASDDGIILISIEEDAYLKYDIALLGNGNNEPINQKQLDLICKLYDWAAVTVTTTTTTTTHEKSNNDNIDNNNNNNNNNNNDDWCDHETCRRYLVARDWNYNAAKVQLKSALEWRYRNSKKTKHIFEMELWQSPKPLKNPLALNLRIIGNDKDGRPITYTCFSQAHDRFDVDSVILHLNLLSEACCTMLRKRRRLNRKKQQQQQQNQNQNLNMNLNLNLNLNMNMNMNQTASSRQWIWVIDFDGFGLKIRIHIQQNYYKKLSSLFERSFSTIFHRWRTDGSSREWVLVS